jgi:glycosyltransferase involved in cell wall biosynthesis
MPVVVVADGGRHRKNTGYGALARGFMLALDQHSPYRVVVQETGASWDKGVPWQEELERLPTTTNLDSGDVVFRISVPTPFRAGRVPTVFYTQNALGDLPPKWIPLLEPADVIVVPGDFDRVVFARYFPSVFVCPQFVDPRIFVPIERFRAEGPRGPAFLFVGSYSYRKGVDLLVPSFIEAFRSGPPATLRVHCAAGFGGEGFNHFLRQVRGAPAHLTIDTFNGSLTPAWMNRVLNRYDAVVTLSRGEGWCMPLHEALLCGKPVIAPRSTAMGEALPREGVRFVETAEKPISSIEGAFGSAMKETYQTESNVCFEPEADDAVQAFRDVLGQLDAYRAAAVRGRQILLERYSLPVIAERLTAALDTALASPRRAGRAAALAGQWAAQAAPPPVAMQAPVSN